MARRAKGTGSIIHVQPLACKSCPDYRVCVLKDDLQEHCSKRDRRERWLYQYIVVGADGKKKRKALSATSRKSLMKKVDMLQTQAEDDKENAKEDGKRHEDVIFSYWIDNWLSTYLPHSVKPSTLKYYQSLLKHIPEHLKKKALSAITTIDLQKMLTNLSTSGGVGGQGLSPKTVRGVRTTVISCLESAVDNHLLITNPGKKTKPPRLVQKKILFLTPEQAAELQRVADNGSYYYDVSKSWKNIDSKYLIMMMSMLVRLAFATGMRRGELFGLLWKNVDLVNKEVHVENGMDHGRVSETKTSNSVRHISIDDETVARLKRFKQCQQQYIEAVGDQYHDSGFVFTNSFGNVMNFDTFRTRYFSRMCKQSGMPLGFTLHGIRHTHATMLLSAGVSPNIISQRLGHSSVAFTLQVYAHVTKTMERTAADTIGSILDGTDKMKKE